MAVGCLKEMLISRSLTTILFFAIYIIMISIELQVDVSGDIKIDDVTNGNYEGQKFINSGEHKTMGAAVEKIKHLLAEVQKVADVSANPVSKMLPQPKNLRPYLFTSGVVFRYTFNSMSERRRVVPIFAIDRKPTPRTNAMELMLGPQWYLSGRNSTLTYMWDDTLLDMDILASKATLFMVAIATAQKI